jgi:prepilin-type N-terminal cleavage/methylation domain-containing protein
MLINKKKRFKKGFTLVEIMLVIGLIAAITSISFPAYRNYLIKNSLEMATMNSANFIRKAQILSMIGENDSRWGVYLTNEEIILYQGDSYTTRDPEYDEIFTNPESIQISGDTEINFEILTGNLDSNKTIIFSGENDFSTILNINRKGNIEY